MRLVAIEWALWAAVASGIAVGVLNATRRFDGAPTRAPGPVPGSVAASRPYQVDSLVPVVITHDLFRFGRRPAEISYDAGRDLNAPNQVIGAPPIPRPQPLLRGLISGDTARALIEGFPGIDGSRLLRAGEGLNGLYVASIARGQVRVTGFDTTWVLTLRRPQ
jgi:hypothetical protein